jgi:ABC-type lipoprotein release transport system permease subunit
VIVGQSLAKVLSVGVGGRLYASTLTLDGNAEAVDLEVVGIYSTGTQSYDRTRIYLHLADLQRLTGLGKRVHEVAVSLGRSEDANAVAAALAARLPDAKLAIRSWSQVRPDILQMLRINELSTDLMVLIIFVVATLGVVNTMLMSVFERTRELGVLKAIGMSAGRIVALIVTETVLLVLGSALVGTLLGLGLDLYMVRYGVDLSAISSGVSLSGIGIRPVIYGAVTWRGLAMPTVILATSCVLASLYPAARAARLQPAVGMRET